MENKEIIPIQGDVSNENTLHILQDDEYFHNELKTLLSHSFEKYLSQIRQITDVRLSQPFRIVEYQENKTVSQTVNPKDYAKTHLHVANTPTLPAEKIIKNLAFGYSLEDNFRRLGPINFLSFDKDQNVVEMGFGTEEVISHFKYHLLGRTLTPQESVRIREVNRKLIDYLRKHSDSSERLHAFSIDRAWPKGLEDDTQLAYFHNLLTPLEEWAKKEGFSQEEMRLAGWYDLHFTENGTPVYGIRDSHVIRIPYFNEKGEIEAWRTRNMKQSLKDKKKYTSWPKDRSLIHTPSVYESLYNAWELEKAQGKTLFITEGEFKCAVTEALTEVCIVGIPGITQVDEMIIDALKKANAREYIVLLDRDPKGKGIMRVDGITDSERASYGIAKKLQQAGVKNVRVGFIPDFAQGAKLGIDDVLLEFGTERLEEIRAKAVRPDRYAENINLNIVFFTLWETRQKVNKVLANYDNAVLRGGQTVDDTIYSESTIIRNKISDLYKEFLALRFQGARTLQQPQSIYETLFQCDRIPKADNKFVLSKGEKHIPLEHFTENILFLRFYPWETSHTTLNPIGANARFPFTNELLVSYFKQSGKIQNSQLKKVFLRGLSISGKSEEDAFCTLNSFMQVVLTGYLSHWFPEDEYAFSEDISFLVKSPEYWEEVMTIQLLIQRKSSGKVVAFANTIAWEQGTIVKDEVSKLNDSFNISSAFLRHQPSVGHRLEKYQMVMNTIWPYWSERNKTYSEEKLSPLGLTPEIIAKNEVVVLTPKDFQELKEHFYNKRLLNQAAYSGLFHWDSTRKISEKFKNDVALLPTRDNFGKIISVCAMPLDKADHISGVLAPTIKPVYQLYGKGRHLLESFNPRRSLFLHNNLYKKNLDVLYITFHELDALLLSQGTESVVGLSSSFSIEKNIIVEIAEKAPKNICVVLSKVTPASVFDYFDTDGIPGYIKEIYMLEQRINAERPDDAPRINIKIVNLRSSLVDIAKKIRITDKVVEDISGLSIGVHEYMLHHNFVPQLYFFLQKFKESSEKFLDYLEIAGCPDFLERRPIESWMNDCNRYYKAMSQLSSAKYKKPLPPIEDYFQQKLNLPVPLSLEELLRLRKEESKTFLHRPVFQNQYSGSVTSIDPQKNSNLKEEVIRIFDNDSKGSDKEITDSRDIVNTLICAAKEKSLGTEAQSAIPVNIKGTVLDLCRKYNKYIAQPFVSFQEQNNEGFLCTIRTTVWTMKEEIIDSVFAPRKKDAEAAAYYKLFQKIQGREDIFGSERDLSKSSQLEDKGNSHTSSVVLETLPLDKHPKMAVFELLQVLNGKPPVIQKVSNNNIWTCSVEVHYKKTIYRSKKKHQSSKEAEKLAFTHILDQIQNKGGKELTQQSKEEKIFDLLTLTVGEKNYVGILQTLAQKDSDFSWPIYDTKQLQTKDGIVLETNVKMGYKEYDILSSYFTETSVKNSKQMAAYDLIMKISALIERL